MESPPAAEVKRLLPLRSVEFQILVSLGSGPKHGYRILREAEARSESAAPRLATLYRAIKRLEDEGLIVEAERPHDEADADERRRYFELTESGRAAASAEASRLSGLLREAEQAALLNTAG